MKNIFLLSFVLYLISCVSCQTSEDYVKNGTHKYLNNDYHGAIAEYDEAIKINPNCIDAYNNRAIAKSTLKDYSGALADWNKVIELNPKDAGAYSCRGLLKIQLQRIDDGCLDLSKALELGDQSANELVNEYCN